eukprot:736118-Lingulodinium_polyedra.AAC.1
MLEQPTKAQRAGRRQRARAAGRCGNVSSISGLSSPAGDRATVQGDSVQHAQDPPLTDEREAPLER